MEKDFLNRQGWLTSNRNHNSATHTEISAEEALRTKHQILDIEQSTHRINFDESERQSEMDVIRKTAQQYSHMADTKRLKFEAERDPHGALMKVVEDLKNQGWKSGWICGEKDSTQKRITVFPPGQEPEPRGVFFKPGEGARRYTIYMDKEQL
jgi:hypothetical protein